MHRFSNHYQASSLYRSLLSMCQFKCQASRILEFLVSRSLLSPRWTVYLDEVLQKFAALQMRIGSEALSTDAKAFLEDRKTSNESIELSELGTILQMLIDGPDGSSRRWWLFGSFTSPLIQGLLEIQNTYMTKNLEQAQVCRKLRGHVLELRDLQRDQLEKRNSLLEISERMHAVETVIERERVKYADLANQYGLSNLHDITKDELTAKLDAFAECSRCSNLSELREILRNPSLHIFVRDYNEKSHRHLKLEESAQDLLFSIEELLSYARVTEETTGVVDLLQNLRARITDPPIINPRDISDEIWKLRERIVNNRTQARLMEAESKLRQSLSDSDSRIAELRQLVRETAQIAEQSISKIFPPGIEIVVD